MAQPFGSYIKRSRAIIRTHGWMVQSVIADEHQPTYTYTVGLSQGPLFHPEIFLVGFHPDLACPLLNAAGNHVRAGIRFDRGMLSDQIIEGFPAAFRPIRSQTTIRSSNAGRASLGRAFDGVQLILPNADGLFPWEEGCDPKYAAVQTALLALAGDPPARQCRFLRSTGILSDTAGQSAGTAACSLSRQCSRRPVYWMRVARSRYAAARYQWTQGRMRPRASPVLPGTRIVTGKLLQAKTDEPL
jgi:hypothetical protein